MQIKCYICQLIYGYIYQRLSDLFGNLVSSLHISVLCDYSRGNQLYMLCVVYRT